MLIVDDSVELRGLVAAAVTSLGHEVVGEASGGESAVTAAAALDPDLVVMDWQMPGMDGVAATAAICGRSPEIVVVAWSSAVNEDVARRFMAAGASAYVDKADWAGLMAELGGRNGGSRSDS